MAAEQCQETFEWPKDLVVSPFWSVDGDDDFGLPCWTQGLFIESDRAAADDMEEGNPAAVVASSTTHADWSPKMFLQLEEEEEEEVVPVLERAAAENDDRDGLLPFVPGDGIHRHHHHHQEEEADPNCMFDDIDITRLLAMDPFPENVQIRSHSKKKVHGRSARTKKNGDEPKKKKARIEEIPSPILPTFNTRRERLQDRVNALQQLVSPFGKSDTASVLFETIEYISYLHNQVNALINSTLQREKQDSSDEEKQGLESRGLCMVPIATVFQSLESPSPVAGLQHLEDLMRDIA